MKSVGDWAFAYDNDDMDLADLISAIQADALRHAADKLTRHTGDWQSIIADLQYEADKLSKP
jgi:hypothetical protein